MSDALRVNGNLYSWGSHLLKLDGERWFGVTALDWDHERSRTFGYGMNRAHGPIAVTNGKYQPNPLKVTMHKHTAVALRKKLGLLADDQRSYGNVAVPMFLQAIEGSNTTTTEWLNCRVTKTGTSVEENPDPTKETWEFQFEKAYEDGLTLWDSSEEG